MFNSHLKKIKEVYRTKMQILQETCELLLPANTHFSKPPSGFYLSISLPENVTAKQVVHMLNEQHVYVDDASRMFLSEYKRGNFTIFSKLKPIYPDVIQQHNTVYETKNLE